MSQRDDRAVSRGPHQSGGGPSAGLGALVRSRRQAMGLTQQAFADLAGISVGTLRDLEQERTRRPLARSITHLASVLGSGSLPVQQAKPACAVPSAGIARSAEPPPRQWVDSPHGQQERLALQVLGPLAAWRNGAQLRLGGLKQRAVLGLLAFTPNTPVPREALIDAVWSQDSPATVITVLQQYISRLRHIVDPGRHPRDPHGLLVSDGTSYRLQVSDDQLDLLAFQRLTARARAMSLAGDARCASELYERALHLWRADPLADTGIVRHHPAVVAVRYAHTTAVMEFAQSGFTAGQFERVLPHLRALVLREPLNERAHGQLMFALAHVGQQAAALREFEDIRLRLDSELGVLPCAELAQIHMKLLRGEIPAEGSPPGWLPVVPAPGARWPAPAPGPRLPVPMPRSPQRAAGIPAARASRGRHQPAPARLWRPRLGSRHAPH